MMQIAIDDKKGLRSNKYYEKQIQAFQISKGIFFALRVTLKV